MELPGSGYLYALATISVLFVGFSSLVLVFRQTIGRATTHYDSYFVLAFMQVGFIVSGGCLLPPLLTLFGLAESTVWPAASGVASLPILLFVATVPCHRRGAVGGAASLFVRLLLLLQSVMGLYLLANTIPVYFAPAAGNYAVVMAGMLCDPMPPRQ